MAEDARSFYDNLSDSYHLIFEDWDASIRRQAAALSPILERECGASSDVHVLDCACGIGTQLLGLAGLGFAMTGCDLSDRAIDRAGREAQARDLHVDLFVADMRNLEILPHAEFDAVICMDNALPHLTKDEDLIKASMEIRGKLRRGGMFMVSIRDYDKLVQEKPTLQGPVFYGVPGKRRIVHQVWDWVDAHHYSFHLYITEQVQDGWKTRHYSATYRALVRQELSHILGVAGFKDCRWLSETETGFYQPIALARAG
jgi:SAM-dependent methyltransferase